MSDPYDLESLHPQMWDNIQFLRKLTDELEYGTRYTWHSGRYSERETKGRKHVKFTGDVLLKIWIHDSSIEGKERNDEDPSLNWPEWW